MILLTTTIVFMKTGFFLIRIFRPFSCSADGNFLRPVLR